MAPFSRSIAHPIWALRDRSPRLRYLREFEQSQWLDPEAIKSASIEGLRLLLAHAAARCPYYRTCAAERGLRPEDVRKPADLAHWPILNKADIQAHGPELVAEGWPSHDLFPYSTGGSSGSPLHFFLHHERMESRTAGMWRHDRWAGWDLGERRGLLWGTTRDFLPETGWRSRLRQLLLDRTLQLDATHLTPAAMEDYLRRLHRFRPRILLAYAQSMAVFARFLADCGWQPPALRGIISSAEVLSPQDRHLIESVFHCRVYDRYGSREVGLIASQCSAGECMHINAESVFVEFVRDGHPVAAGELGEVLVTDLRNYAMPLIRYRIGDVGSPQSGACRCGRGLPLMRMAAGRVTDFIVRPDGGIVSGISLVTYLITGRPGIAQVQILQPELHQLILRVVPGNRFSEADLDCLRARLPRYVGEGMKFRFEMVSEIPKEPSGKYRFTISEVSPQLAFANDRSMPLAPTGGRP